MDLRLELKKVVGGVATAITGAAGAGVYAGGNVLKLERPGSLVPVWLRHHRPGWGRWAGLGRISASS
jgi:hypothetical protein